MIRKHVRFNDHAISEDSFNMIFKATYKSNSRKAESLCILEHKPKLNGNNTAIKLHFM